MINFAIPCAKFKAGDFVTAKEKIKNIEDMLLSCSDELDMLDLLVNKSFTVSKNKELCTNRYQISGCTTNMWMKCSLIKDRIHIEFESDSLIVKGAMALIAEIFEGSCVEEAKELNVNLINLFPDSVVNPTVKKNGLKRFIKAIINL